MDLPDMPNYKDNNSYFFKYESRMESGMQIGKKSSFCCFLCPQICMFVYKGILIQMFTTKTRCSTDSCTYTKRAKENTLSAGKKKVERGVKKKWELETEGPTGNVHRRETEERQKSGEVRGSLWEKKHHQNFKVFSRHCSRTLTSTVPAWEYLKAWQTPLRAVIHLWAGR